MRRRAVSGSLGARVCGWVGPLVQRALLRSLLAWYPRPQGRRPRAAPAAPLMSPPRPPHVAPGPRSLRHYRRMNFLGNALRRCGNAITCALGPLLYRLRPGLPFALFGLLTVLWAAALALLFAQRASELLEDDFSDVARRSAWSATLHAGAVRGRRAGRPRLDGLRRYMVMSFTSQEQRYWAQQAARSQEPSAAAAAAAGLERRPSGGQGLRSRVIGLGARPAAVAQN